MRSQHGGGKLGAIFWLAVLAAFIFCAVRIIPMKVKVMDLHDFTDRQIQNAGTSYNLSEAGLIKSILEQAETLGLPLEKKQLKLRSSEKEVVLTMRHQVHVDLLFYDWVWDYDKEFRHLRM